jgi:hypothetical protein
MKGNKMFLSPITSNVRTFAIEIFLAERNNAIRDSLLDKFSGKSNRLLSFPEKERANIPNRKYLGVTEIPIEKVVGSISRNNDFDHKFRPLKSNLRERWVNVYTSLEAENWPPIRVHKIGEIYYVEDGHHRVSVARTMGKAFIPAEVWEYTFNPCQVNQPKQHICSQSCHSAEPCPA